MGRSDVRPRQSGLRALRRLALAMLAAGGGVAAAPLLPWFELRVDGVGAATVAGHGKVRIDTPGDDAGDLGLDWALGEIPDGWIATALGVVLVVVAVAWLARSLDRTERVHVRRSGLGAVAFGAVTLGWLTWSWLRQVHKLERNRQLLLEVVPSVEPFLGQFRLEPGVGLLLVGAAAAVAVLAGLRAALLGAGRAAPDPFALARATIATSAERASTPARPSGGEPPAASPGGSSTG